MDMIDGGVLAAGALVGGVAAFKMTEGDDIVVRIASIAAAAVIGAAVTSFAYAQVQEHNPILNFLK